MKSFFANKMNVILSLVLVAVVGVAGYFTFQLFKTPQVTAINFVGMKQDAVELWIKENKIQPEMIIYDEEYSEDYDKGVIFFQTIKEGEEINEQITLTVSKGTDPDLHFDLGIFVSAKIEELQNYLTKEKISMISISYDEGSELEGGTIIGIDPLKCSRNDVINVMVAGKKPNSNEENKDPEADSTNKVLIPDNLLGLDESAFISKLNKLGFNNLSKSSVSYYSDNMKANTVYSYDDGNFTTDTKIRYALCAGKIDVDSVAKEITGVSVSKANATVKSYNDRNAQITVKYDLNSGTVDKCTVSKKTISCTLRADGDGNKEAVIPGNLLGKSESEFLKKLSDLGFTNIVKEETTYYSTTLAKGTIFQYDDGTYKLSDKVNYALSAGALDVEEFANSLKGISDASASSRVTEINKRNGRIEYKTSGSGNTVDNCSVSGRTISCTLKNVSESEIKTATIPDNLLGKSENEFLETVKKLGFASFAKSSTTYYSTTLAKGTIFQYDDGTLKTNVTINYALSAGPLDVNAVASELNGKTADQAKNTVSDYNGRNGRITLKIGSEVESSQKAGTLINCKANDRAIACDVAKAVSSTTPSTPQPPIDNTVELKNYVGSANPCGSNSSCTINEVKFTITKEYSSQPDGIVIKQSVGAGKVNKGTSVTLTVSKGEEPVAVGYLPSANMMNSSYKADTVEGTWNLVSAYLKKTGFTDINYKPETVQSSLTTGCVVRIEVNGKTVAGNSNIPLNSSILIVICSGQSN